MEKTKVPTHCYSTRHSKIPKIEDSINQYERISGTALSKVTKRESPSATKLCRVGPQQQNGGRKQPARPVDAQTAQFSDFLISGYASPPCRPFISSSQITDPEIEWDLTSPSARRYQVLKSDKKTSTPNRTPTREGKKELRPRLALCKKNIALSSTKDNSPDLVNELAALNDLVNTEQAKQNSVLTPPKSEINENEISTKLPNELNVSCAFEDDSFFSESILLSTQALEQEAVTHDGLNALLTTPSITMSRSFPSAHSSPEGNPIRRTFDINNDDLEECNGKFVKPLGNPLKSSTQVIRNSVSEAKPVPPSVEMNSFIPPSSLRCPSLLPNGKQHQSILKSNSKPLCQPITPPNCSRNNMRDGILPPPPVTKNIGIRRLSEQPVMKKRPDCTLRPNVLPPPVKPDPQKVSCSFQSSNLFDDDDDDLLFAVAEEIESQYVQQSTNCKPDLIDDGDDDVFFQQPEVLAFISQIESESCSTQKSTADLMEEKRQAAIRKREQRMMNRR